MNHPFLKNFNITYHPYLHEHAKHLPRKYYYTLYCLEHIVENNELPQHYKNECLDFCGEDHILFSLFFPQDAIDHYKRDLFMRFNFAAWRGGSIISHLPPNNYNVLLACNEVPVWIPHDSLMLKNASMSKLNIPRYHLEYFHSIAHDKNQLMHALKTLNPIFYTSMTETGNIFRFDTTLFLDMDVDYRQQFQKMGFIGHLRHEGRMLRWIETLFPAFNEILYLHYKTASQYISLENLPFYDEYKTLNLSIEALNITPWDAFQNYQQIPLHEEYNLM